jgi:hypothetical protein
VNKNYRQHYIRAIAGKVVNSSSVHLTNFCDDGQIIALKSTTALILVRYGLLYKTTGLNGLTPQSRRCETEKRH